MATTRWSCWSCTIIVGSSIRILRFSRSTSSTVQIYGGPGMASGRALCDPSWNGSRNAWKPMSSPLASPLSADGVSGYLHPGYAESLSEFGSPLLLPRSNGSILIRRIPDTEYHDATAPYPLLFCLDWSQLPVDLDALGTVSPSVHGAPNLVSMTAVTDPFADVDESLFRRSCVGVVLGPDVGFYDFVFRGSVLDVVLTFKEAFRVALKDDFDRSISSHHRRNARKAAKILEVTAHACSVQILDDWLELYSNLIRRHHIRGVARFSRTSFERQFKVPGLVAFTATHNGQTVGMTLWYVQSRRAYYHLGAYSDVGYELGASFALFTRAIEHFHAEGL